MEATLRVNADFQHGPLDQTQSSIRLLEILPDLQQGLIQCKLTHSTIRDSYICLSYMWGDGSRSRTILVNGKHFRVRTNLFNFLHLMQTQPLSHDTSTSPQPRLRYWIDALCIDQSNSSERNHQVAQMGRIFSSAQLVHVWLGYLPSAARMRYIPSVPSKQMTLSDWLCAQYPYNYLMARHVFGNEYWTRAWVTQEVVLARAVIVSLGPERMSLAEMVDLLRDYEYDWKSRHNHFYQLSQRAQTANALLGQSLLILLFHFQNKRCSVQRDRVFSLLSLCGSAPKIEVDYQARRVDLVAQILELLPDAICVCSATVVASSLGLHTESGGIPESAKNSTQPWLDVHFTAVIGKSLVFDRIKLGHDAQHPCSLFVLSLAEWLLRVKMESHQRLIQIVREGKTLPFASALHTIGWTQDQWYSPDPPAAGCKLGIRDLDRNICMIRVALWALNPGIKFPQYPNLCHRHENWRTDMTQSIKRIEVVSDIDNELTYKDGVEPAASWYPGRQQPGWY